MMPNKGYCEAKRLLHKHYGDELRIASAYIDKALKWPQVKSDDGKALSAYAMFLIGCRNTMEDIEFLEEMDNPTNLRTVVSKLPYKLKERWRAEAYDIKERRGRRARFADLVNYIDRQARIAMVPFLEISQTAAQSQVERLTKKKSIMEKERSRGSSFATNVSPKAKGLKKRMLSQQIQLNCECL